METVRLIKITEDTMPCNEVIAIDGRGQALVGFIDAVGDGYQCESEDSMLNNVTHFIHIPKINKK